MEHSRSAIKDVTELAEARERDIYAATIFRSSGHALLGLSSDGIILSWNAAAERLYGYTTEEVVRSPISTLASTGLATEREDILTRLRAGEGITMETAIVAKDGRFVTVILNAAPMLNGRGEMVGISASLTDITERKTLEQQLRESEQRLSALLKEKQILVRETHHRVGNNLQTVVSLLNLHAAQSNNAYVVEALSVAEGRVQAIARLHQALFASETLAEINFGEHLKRLTMELKKLHGRPEITVQVSADDIALPEATASALGLIANELILNCFKHAFPCGRAGRVVVSIEHLADGVALGSSPNSGAIRLRVQDDGMGLSPRSEIDTSDSLGLRLVHLLAQQLKAQVQAQTEAGFDFVVTVPVTTDSLRRVGPKSV